MVPPARAEWTAPMSAYTVTRPTDLVGIVPHILGYTPTDSLVLVTGSRSGDRGEVGLTVRFDFGFSEAAHLDAEDLAAVVSTLEHAEGAAAVFPILFSAEVPTALGLLGEPESELLVDHFRLPVFLICAALAEAGYEVADPLWAGGGFCGSLDDPEELYGRAETTDTEVAVRLIADGRSHAEDFAAATAHPVPPPELLTGAARIRASAPSAAARYDAALADLRALLDLAEDPRATVAQVPGVLSPGGVVGMELMCAELWSRDCIEMILGFDHPDFSPARIAALEPGTFAAWARPIARSAAAAESMIGLSPERPDFARTAYSVAYLDCLVPAVDEASRPAVLAMLAWLEWGRARNSFADHYACRSLALDPDYTLAGLVHGAVTRGLPPRWMAASGR